MDWGLTIAGLGIGFIVGLTGMGGGALMTPVLVLVFKVPALAAVSSDLVASVVMKPIGGGVHLRHGNVNMRLVRWLVAGSVPTAFVSVWVLDHLSRPDRIDDIVQHTIGVALVASALGLAVKGVFAARSTGVTRDIDQVEVRVLPTLAIGMLGGAMVGLTSVGSGSLMMVLLMVIYPRLSTRSLVGTDLVQAVPLVAAAALGHALFGQVQFDVAGSLLVGAVPGVYLGARISSRAADQYIRPLLVVVLVGSGLKMLEVSTTVVAVVTGVVLVVAVVTVVRSERNRV